MHGLLTINNRETLYYFRVIKGLFIMSSVRSRGDVVQPTYVYLIQ